MRRARLVPWAALLALAACQETGGPSAGGGIRLSLQLASALSGETLEILPSYRRTSQAVVALPPLRIGLEEAATQTVTVEVDVTGCLADPDREGGGPGCPLRLSLLLRDAADALVDSTAIGPLSAVPGVPVEPPAVTLRHITTITVNSPGQTITIGAPAQLTALVTDRSSATVTGRPLAWSSSNTAVATVDQSGLVTPVFPGPVQIRATLAGRPFGPEGSVSLTVVSPAQAVIGPAGGSILSADGSMTLGIPPGAIATPTTVSIATFTPEDGADRAVPGRLFQVLPLGLTLALPATVTINYGGQAVPGGSRNETALRLFYVPPGDSVALVATGSVVNTGAKVVTGSISQFSIVAAGLAMVAVRALAVGDQHACAALSTGQGLCWGAGATGELGWSINDGSADPVMVTGTQNFTAMSAGGGFSCGLTSGGQVWCWGANGAGQLGNGSTTQTLAPVQVSLPVAATAIESTLDATCALDATQRVWCWGRNNNGQLGVATGSTCGGQACSTTPVQLPANVVVSTLTAGFQRFCGVSAGFQGCWGSNIGTGLGLNGSTPFSQTPVAPPTGAPGAFTALFSGGFHSCGLLAGGAAWCWGGNNQAAMGLGSAGALGSLTPQAMAGGIQFATMDLGSPNSIIAPACGVTAAGVGYCWGSNSRGQLGTTAGGLETCSAGPCSGTPLPVAGGLNLKEIHGGANFACGLLAGAAGQVWCWGAGNLGQLGNGNGLDSSTPMRVY